MILHAVDNNNDIILEAGQLKTVTDGAATVQLVRSRLLLYLGEYPLDITQGVDYLGTVLNQPEDLAALESAVKTTILTTPGVEQLTSFELNVDRGARTLSIDFESTTTFNQIIGSTINVRSN